MSGHQYQAYQRRFWTQETLYKYISQKVCELKKFLWMLMQICLPSPHFSQEIKDTTTSLPSQHHLHATCLWFTSSCFKAEFTCMFLYRFSQTSLSDKNTSSTTALFWWHSQICPSVMGKKKKRRTRAIYKVINNLFFLYINLYKDNITYVCDSNFLYRILLIFNMALKGTVTYSYTISLINLQFLSYVSEHTALSNLRPFINFWCCI